jgi:hypothetical protein
MLYPAGAIENQGRISEFYHRAIIIPIITAA